ncbi:flagellar M-ring protein FliF [Vibrio harveyi]|nr:flagellar M-ring protein FliF [Vibrio harveyi]
MTNILKNKLSVINLKSAKQGVISSSRLIALICIISIAIATTIVLSLWQGGSEYRPLYGAKEHFDSNQVMSILAQHGIDYYVDGPNGTIMVARDALSNARLVVAAAGIEPLQPVGLELLTKDSSLGTSQFVENARYRYGLEGELARSILTLDGVSNARVHLAIPKQTLFIGRNQEHPTASVIVSLLPGKQLTPGNISAIVNLIAGSVPNLTAEHVNVIDQHGNLLSHHSADGVSAQSNNQYLSFVQSLEDDVVQSASRMLRRMVGIDNFQVEVAVGINFDRVEATEEEFAPQGTIKSEYSSFDKNDLPKAEGVPGALSNRPPEEEETDTNALNNRGESSKDYVIGRTQKHIKYQQGTLKQLSVAVLLNGKPDTFSTEQLDSMKAMLSDALGLNAARGDKISVLVYPFSQEKAPLISSESAWWNDPIWLDYLRYLLASLVAIVVLFVIVKPTVKALFGTGSTIESSQPQALSEESHSLSSIEGVHVEQAPSMIEANNVSPEVLPSQELPELPSAETGLETQVSYLNMLSEREPERVAHVIKQWMTKNEEH